MQTSLPQAASCITRNIDHEAGSGRSGRRSLSLKVFLIKDKEKTAKRPGRLRKAPPLAKSTWPLFDFADLVYVSFRAQSPSGGAGCLFSSQTNAKRSFSTLHLALPKPSLRQALLLPIRCRLFNHTKKVGIEDCLHIEFEYDKSKYHLKDCIMGKVYFLLVRIKIKHMEVDIIRREQCGT